MTSSSPKRSKHRASRLANLALALVVTVLSVLAAEWVFRHFERGWLNPELPSLDGEAPVNLSLLRYNDGIIDRRVDDDEFRILSFGDSFTYSVMERDLSYSAVLQQRLQEHLPDRRIRVVNLGEPATSPRNFRMSYDFWAPRLEHQAVLFLIFLGNDVRDDAFRWTPEDWSPNVGIIEQWHPILAAYDPRVPRKFPLRMLDYAWAWWMSVRARSTADLPDGYNPAAATDFAESDFLRINREYYTENFDPDKLPDLLPGYEQVVLLFRRAQAIAEDGRPVAVALGPGQPQVDSQLRARILAEADRAGSEFDPGLAARIIRRIRDRVAPDVLLLDLTLPFRDWSNRTGKVPYFRRNTHWDRDGNRLAGEWLAAALLSAWFGLPGMSPDGSDRDLTRHPEDNVLLEPAAIDRYLAPLLD